MRLFTAATIAVSFLFISSACRRASSLQNAATLQRIGFHNLGNGFYYRPGLFLVKLDNQEHLVSVVTSRDVFGRIGKDFDREQLYKAVAIAPKESSDGGKDLWLVDERGSCTEVPVNGDSQGPCEPKPSTLFTPEEMSGGTPLKVRLAKIAREAASSVYTIADPRASHTDLYAVYRDEKVVFIGNSAPDRFSTNTKILGYRKVKDLFRDTELGALELEGEYISYELASNGYIVTGSAKQIKEISPKLTAAERFTESDSSGFKIGGVNSNDVIDRMNSLTEKTVEQIESDARPGDLSSSGFLGDDEKFKDRLKADNSYVRARGFTHQALAEPLFSIMNILDRIGDRRFDDFTYRGHHYRAEYRSYRGFQQSLFNDGLQVDRDFTVTNLGTGKQLEFSPLLPFYISRYGFYEGKTNYRMEPAAIIETFELRSKE
jgi:hypothetical protein